MESGLLHYLRPAAAIASALSSSNSITLQCGLQHNIWLINYDYEKYSM